MKFSLIPRIKHRNCLRVSTHSRPKKHSQNTLLFAGTMIFELKSTKLQLLPFLETTPRQSLCDCLSKLIYNGNCSPIPCTQLLTTNNPLMDHGKLCLPQKVSNFDIRIFVLGSGEERKQFLSITYVSQHLGTAYLLLKTLNSER